MTVHTSVRHWTVDDAAQFWHVHRNTARRRMAELHRRFGDRYVWRVGRRGELRTTLHKLEQVRTILEKKDEIVSAERFSREVARLWAAIRKLRKPA